MHISRLFNGLWALTGLWLLAFTLPSTASTVRLPLSDLAQDQTDMAPDDALRRLLASEIEAQLMAAGFENQAGTLLAQYEVPSLEQDLASLCLIPRPKHVRTEPTTAQVTLTEQSRFDFDLEDIRNLSVDALVVGEITLDTRARVKWGQAFPFLGSCKTIGSDSGTISVSLPFALSLEANLELALSYDAEAVALIADKQARVSSQVNFYSGDIDPDFGSLSITNALVELFEPRLLEELEDRAKEALAESVVAFNFRLDGRDSAGQPDPNLTAFNQPTTFLLEQDADDLPLVRALLDELGLPDLVITLVENRGIEILGQLAALDESGRQAYLGELGAGLACDAVLSRYQIAMPQKPLFTKQAGNCRVASSDEQNLFADNQCTNPVDFAVTDLDQYCTERASEQAGEFLGNAAAWEAQPQPHNPLPQFRSRAWTLQPGPTLDIGLASLRGLHQPYSKQIEYKSVTTDRGQCALEMRVYKKDLNDTELKPMLAFHGGTWQHRGFSFLGLESTVARYTDAGYLVFVPFYRLVGESDGNPECHGASWRDLLSDTEDALTWVNQNAPALGAAQIPVTVFGQSAGAHLAAWLASYRSGEIDRALLMYPPLDTLDFIQNSQSDDSAYREFRDFGLRSLARLFGSQRGFAEVDLRLLPPALTKTDLEQDPDASIPDAVFNLNLSPLGPYAKPCRDHQDSVTLLACLKNELASFLTTNAYFDVLNQVPITVIQGGADTLVPYQQSIRLCGARTGSAPSETLTEPLTRVPCGPDSTTYVVRDAEHALDLGPCLGPLCPAGAPGTASRGAAALALDEAFASLDVERPHVAPSRKILSTQDQWALVDASTGVTFKFFSSTTGDYQGSWAALPSPWTYVDAVALPDGSVGVLGKKDNITRFTVGNLTNPSTRHSYPMGQGWTIDQAVAIDNNTVAYLAQRQLDQLPVIEVKSLTNDNRERLIYPLNRQWSILGLEAQLGSQQLVVLGRHRTHRNGVLQFFNATTGASLGAVGTLPPPWRALSLRKIDARTVAVVLRRNDSGQEIIQVFDVATQSLVRNVYPIGAGSNGWTLQDVQGLSGDLAVLSTQRDSGSTLVQIKNPETGSVVRNHWFIPSPWLYGQGFAVVNNPDQPNLALLLQHSESQSPMIQMRNGLSNQVISNIHPN